MILWKKDKSSQSSVAHSIFAHCRFLSTAIPRLRRVMATLLIQTPHGGPPIIIYEFIYLNILYQRSTRSDKHNKTTETEITPGRQSFFTNIRTGKTMSVNYLVLMTDNNNTDDKYPFTLSCLQRAVMSLAFYVVGSRFVRVLCSEKLFLNTCDSRHQCYTCGTLLFL